LGLSTFGTEIFGNLSVTAGLVLAAAGYVLGVVMDLMAEEWHRRLFKQSKLSQKVFESFCTDHPDLETKIQADDRTLLLQFLKKTGSDHIAEIERMNVNRVLLRNISLGLALLAVVHVVYFFAISPYLWNLVVALGAAGLSIAAGRKGPEFAKWFFEGLFDAGAAEAMQIGDFFTHKEAEG
jgi:hypothetical protein